ncbi:MAG: hypothetical protein NTY77_06985 [Elusimicrobia bacterium]|nr:hypothetical protein [Elusimicrobiota bacterium]
MADKEAKQSPSIKESDKAQTVIMTKKEVCGVLGIKEVSLVRLERVAKLQPHLQGYTAREVKLLAGTLAAILPPRASK